MSKVGIIGGSGLDNPDILEQPRDQTVGTAWGAPSAPLRLGQIGGVEVALLARHGREHTQPPSQVNYRANIQALKDAGCTPHPGHHCRGFVARGNPARRPGHH